MRPPSQFKKFENIFTKLVNDINHDQSNSIEIIDKIKTELEKELPTVYEEWKNSEFDINFKFKLQNAAKKIVETTLLHASVECEAVPCVSIVQYLLNKKADPNVMDSNGNTPLHMAFFTRDDENKEVVELLLEEKADPNISDCQGRTPLYLACMFHYDKGFNAETIKLLLKSGSDINKGNNERDTPLHQLVESSIGISENLPTWLEEQSLELVRLFVKHGANIYTKNKDLETPKDFIESRRRSSFPMHRKLAKSVRQILEEQESSREYHGKLLELLERTKDLKYLAEIIGENGLMSIKGIQACSQAIPQILGISGIEIAVKGTIVEGEIERGFSHGTGWPVVDIKGNPIKYHDLFNTLISFFETNSVIKSLPHPKSKFLGWEVGSYVMNNSETIKREFWGEPRVSSTSTETTEVEGNITTQHVTQKEPGKGTVKQHGKKKTKGDTSKEKRKKKEDK